MSYLDTFITGYKNYASYLWSEISNPSVHNYFYWLIFGSLIFFGLELLKPWRKDQPRFRKDFWLDAFYMFFNFFIFSLIIYNAATDVIVKLFNDGILSTTGFDLQASNPMKGLPMWSILLIGMIMRDFIQWWVHRLLHKVEFLWKFHKVHHSVEQMGFAAQLRYHWMENIVYRTIEYIPLAIMGIGLYDFFIIHIFAFAWGHFNHANITIKGSISGAILGAVIGFLVAFGFYDINIIDPNNVIIQLATILGFALSFSIILGPFMRKIFNSPEMHIWHHAYTLPHERRNGVNFGLTLAIWDYIFGTAYIPSDGRDIKLGFEDIESFPDDFVGQQMYGIFNK